MTAPPTKARKPFVHVPLGAGPIFGPWCLELPADYATSAPVLIAITTAHPELLDHEGWNSHLWVVLKEAVRAAEGGDDESLRLSWRILAVLAKADRTVVRRIRAAIESSISKTLLRSLKRRGVSASGRRYSLETLASYDEVARLSAMDKLAEAGFSVFAGTSKRLPARSWNLRAAEVLSERLGLKISKVLDDHPELTKLSKLVGRVKRVAVPLHYVLRPCQHLSPIEVAPIPLLWATADLRPAPEVARARTIAFRSRIAGVHPPLPDYMKSWRGDWHIDLRAPTSSTG